MKKRIMFTFVLATMLSIGSINLFASPTDNAIKKQMNELSLLMEQAKKKKLDIQREELALHTAKLCYDFALWDEANPQATIAATKQSAVYRKRAEEMATLLPKFEKDEVLALLNSSIENIKQVISGQIKRKDVPEIEWAKVKRNGKQLTNPNGQPVFIHNYNFMPGDKRYTKFYGNFGGYHYDFGFLPKNKKISGYKLEELNNPKVNHIGSPFYGHGISKWLKEEYPGIEKGTRTFTKFDTDSPIVRERWEAIISQIAPKLSGQPRTELGYLLANEPHWHTAAKTWDTPIEKLDKAGKAWDTGDVSENTMAKFQKWLESTHGNISTLNTLWGSNYKSFNQARVELPMDNRLLGTPKWYDWMKFNQYRITEWFTFLIETTRKYDPHAVANVKVMPNLWAENKRDHGLDFEAICNLSGVIGNDASAYKKRAWGAAQEWEKDYIFEWKELCMGYDFFRSIAPNKPNYNSEAHYTMHTGFQWLEMTPEYARCAYWLSGVYGANAHTTWVWSRKLDKNGNLDPKMNQAASSHIGSITTQPRILNEVALTMMDLTAHGYDIAALQQTRQPIRLFYSETSAINKRTHMSQLFEQYEDMTFNGVAIGFATENIINSQNNKNWDMIVVSNHEFVTVSELKALQRYLDNGGTILLDDNSLQSDQYQRPHPASMALTPSKGKIIRVNGVEEITKKSFELIHQSSRFPISIEQSNKLGKHKCLWRVAQNGKGRYVLTLTNVGKEATNIKIKLDKKAKCVDLMTGQIAPLELTIKPEQVLFYEFGKLKKW